MNAAPRLAVDPRAAAFSAELTMWALAYAAHGIPVLPAFDKRPARGLTWNSATLNPSLIEGYWRTWPLALIATLTGEASGLIVLDIDRKNGVDGFETMRANGWAIPHDAIEIVTPSGGSHFYFRWQGEDVRSTAGKIGTGIDIRGRRGLVILPPSRKTLDGPDYHFAEGQENREPGVLFT